MAEAWLAGPVEGMKGYVGYVVPVVHRDGQGGPRNLIAPTTALQRGGK